MDMFFVLVWIHCPGVGVEGVTGGVGGAELDEWGGDTAGLARGVEAVLESPVLMVLLLFTKLNCLVATGGRGAGAKAGVAEAGGCWVLFRVSFLLKTPVETWTGLYAGLYGMPLPLPLPRALYPPLGAPYPL